MSQGEGNASQAYRVQKVSTVVAGTDVQVREFVVAPGENIPWHYHSEITDWCYCLEGVVAAETRGPGGHDEVSTLKLLPGQSCRTGPGIVHRLTNGGDILCRYLLVQGGGKYDFNTVEVNDPARP
jgi:quercetin dioxygenase-like cupin family protein